MSIKQPSAGAIGRAGHPIDDDERNGQPVELASIYVRLAADDGSFATGNIYGSGGGHGQP